MQSVANQAILVIDHVKIEKVSLYPSFKFDEIDVLVTDNAASAKKLKFVKEYKVKII